MRSATVMATALVYVWVLITLSGCAGVRSTDDIPAVGGFDANRYMGKWHEIARLPKWYEKDMVNVTATYSLEDGRLKVENMGFRDGRESRMTAYGKVAGATDVGEFEIGFLRWYSAPYRIIWISPDYDIAMTTGKSRSSFWILARKRTIPQEKLDELIRLAKAWGFDTAKLEFPQQVK